jgi:addiction module HigA family antidote
MPKTIPYPHPGETILHDYLDPLGMSMNALAVALDVLPMRVNKIVHGKTAITADTALRLARFFDTTPQFWLNLQAGYDIRKAEQAVGARIIQRVRPRLSIRAARIKAHARRRAPSHVA